MNGLTISRSLMFTVIHFGTHPLRPRKKKFVSCNGPEKNRVGKKIFDNFKNVCFMHVLR